MADHNPWAGPHDSSNQQGSTYQPYQPPQGQQSPGYQQYQAPEGGAPQSHEPEEPPSQNPWSQGQQPQNSYSGGQNPYSEGQPPQAQYTQAQQQYSPPSGPPPGVQSQTDPPQGLPPQYDPHQAHHQQHQTHTPPPALPPRNSTFPPDEGDRVEQVETLQTYEAMAPPATEDDENQAILQREFPNMDSALIAAIYGDSKNLAATREMLFALGQSEAEGQGQGQGAGQAGQGVGR